jgi:hypothetical protein
MALAYNVTVMDPGGAGHLRVFPGDMALPNASTVNFGTRDNVTNGTLVKLSPRGTIKVYNGSGLPVRFVVDVVGYYRSDSGATFYPMDPARAYDSRAALPGGGAMTAGEPSRVISVAESRDANGAVIARDIIPAQATAIAHNLGVTNTGVGGHLRFYQAGSALPNGVALSWPAPGHTRANASMAGISGDKKVAVYSSTTGPHVFLDVLGYYR